VDVIAGITRLTPLEGLMKNAEVLKLMADAVCRRKRSRRLIAGAGSDLTSRMFRRRRLVGKAYQVLCWIHSRHRMRDSQAIARQSR
jgi:hypothetical protein